ncbi:hypothetical protein [Streptomyces sp. M3]|uniref:hypothetical protein n=1 Tax=Streptomyces sp. M3 TaxID=295102 RepID=UPI0013E917B0|nr:hypothetical protein [Streptomyces sp. M3]
MPATDDLHDTERTTEELAEAMFSGNVIEVFFDTLSSSASPSAAWTSSSATR